jgi:phage terminase large subunit-like protein
MMNQTITRLRSEFARILKKAEPEEIREFFRPSDNMEELVVKCVMWGHHFLSKYLYKPTPEFHYDLVERFFRRGNDYTAAPRGFSKTTVLQFCIAYSCVNGLDEFIVLIEKTFTEASEVLESIREEFKLNDEITRVYGDLSKIGVKGKEQANIRDSIGDFFLNGVRLRARGFDTPVRGLKSRHARPSRIIIDDCESDEHIENVEQRKKYLENYIRGVIPAVDSDFGVIKMFGTILHDDSLLNTLIRNHNGKVYAAWDENRKLLWPSNWTVEKLEQKRMEMRISEKGDAGFYQEYFNQPLSDEDQIFRPEMFRYFNGLQLIEIKKKPHRIYTLVDPAISKKTTADFTAIVTVLVDYLNRIFVVEITRARLDPIETIKAIFAHYERHQPVYVGIETVSYQKALKYFIEEEKRRQHSTVQSMQVMEIRPTIDKVTKIKKLQPKYAIANVYHNSDDVNTPILEQELKRFPKSVTDDVADCLSNVIEIIIPIQKTVDRAYKKFALARKTGVKVMY